MGRRFEDWERLQARRALSPTAAQALLGSWRGDLEVARVSSLSGGLANTNLRVELEREVPDLPLDLVLRLHQRAPEGAERERRLVEHVAPRVPVAQVLHGPVRCGDTTWSLLPFVSGTPLSELLESGSPVLLERAGRACGELLHELQQVELPGGPPPGPAQGPLDEFLRPRPPLPPDRSLGDHYLDLLLGDGNLRRRLGPERSRKLEAIRESELGRSPPGPGVLCHADFKGPNILLRVTEESVEVAALLDWEFSFCGPPLFDLAALLRWSHQLPASFPRGVASGYRDAGGRLEPGWWAGVKRLDLANLLSMLPPEGTAPRRERGLLELLDRTLAHWPPEDP